MVDSDGERDTFTRPIKTGWEVETLIRKPLSRPGASVVSEQICPGRQVMVMRSRSEVLALLDDLDAARAVKGQFLCFHMIPVAERFGQWRFAGAATDMAEAFERLDSFLTRMNDDPETRISFRELAELEVLDYPDSLDTCWSAPFWAKRDIGPVSVEILAEGGAPHDEVGFAVLAVPSLEGHPYATRSVESRHPATWDDPAADIQADLDKHPDAWLE